jgi:hypothetical protein
MDWTAWHTTYKKYKLKNMTTEQVKKLTRKDLIQWLCRNDSNGIYTDKDSLNEGLPILTIKEARELVLNQIGG